MNTQEITALNRIQSATDFATLEQVLKDLTYHEVSLGFDDKIYLIENFFEDPKVIIEYMTELIEYAKQRIRYDFMNDEKIRYLLSEEIDMFDENTVTLYELYDKKMGSIYHHVNHDQRAKRLVEKERAIYNTELIKVLEALKKKYEQLLN